MRSISTGHDGRTLIKTRAEHHALAFCGWSGAGKTTLLESLIPRLTARGLSVAVVKHDAHGVRLDTPGKDSDRLFRAGATVCLRGPDEGAWRFHSSAEASLETALRNLQDCHDAILVEGHKDTPLPKIWLEHQKRTGVPEKVGNVVAVLPWGDRRVGAAESHVMHHFDRVFRHRRQLGGILVGGKSRRMGREKQLIEIDGVTMAERVAAGLDHLVDDVVLLGGGRVPKPLSGYRRLPDVNGAGGPMDGILSALRWDPDAAWIIASCDHPRLTADQMRWLAGQRRPGRWAVMPRLEGVVQPLLALYEPQALPLLEALSRSGQTAPWRVSQHPKIATPDPPARFADGWLNANTPAELEVLSEGA